MAGLRDVSVLLEPKMVRPIRLTELLVAQLCTYSMLSALCFAYPLYLFDCSGSSTLYGAVVATAFIPGVLAQITNTSQSFAFAYSRTSCT